jgi:hypothetical protein
MASNNATKPGADAFHRERSKCIDAFAALEEAIIVILTGLAIKSGSETFGQKLELLSKAKANPRISKAKIQALQSMLPRCKALGELRNDIVHSRLQIEQLGEETRACFTNTRHCLSGSQTARLFTLSGLRSVRSEAVDLASELQKILTNPASSPPPPSPAAAGGP